MLVIHDEQSALTADRLRRLQRVLADSPGRWVPDDETPDAVVSPLAGLVMVDSRDDPRVQVADLLAGAALRPTDGRSCCSKRGAPRAVAAGAAAGWWLLVSGGPAR